MSAEALRKYRLAYGEPPVPEGIEYLKHGKTPREEMTERQRQACDAVDAYFAKRELVPSPLGGYWLVEKTD